MRIPAFCTAVFRRETNVETIALGRIVKHCLEKDRDHRFQSARDIAFNLQEQSSPTGLRKLGLDIPE